MRMKTLPTRLGTTMFTILLCLLQAIAFVSTQSIDREGYISIDCGKEEPFSIYGINFTVDSAYIDTGINNQVSRKYLDDGVEVIYYTLRSFPDGIRNCYNLKMSNEKGNKYLIRAQFMYGNYDGSNNIPSFEVYIGVNLWSRVTLDDAKSEIFLEIIHQSKENYVSICLVNIHQGTPFINALYLRPLDNSIYVSEGSLSTFYRYNTSSFATTQNYYSSHPDDVYDRFWSPLPHSFTEHWEIYKSSANVTSIINDAYKLPPSIFNAGVQPSNGGRSLGITSHIQDYAQETFYAYCHFTETEKLSPDDLREFQIIINKNLVGTFRPEYLHSLTVASKPIIVGLQELQESPFTIYIEQTNASTLPPILNAIELYKLVPLAQSATNQADVDAIMDVKTKYGAIIGWQGDPCLPVAAWDGLNCSNNGKGSPRITSMNLSGRGLTGELLPSISSLSSLSYLNLSNNNLTGIIPEFLANMPSLQVIDLKGNKFHGSVPIELLEKVKNGSLSLSIDEGPDLCTSIACAKKNNKRKITAAVVSSVLLVVLVVVVVCYAYRWMTKQGIPHPLKSKLVIKSKGRQFSYPEIVTMTNNFQTIIGKGASGTVYHGSFEDGSVVAIKILNSSSSSQLGVESFQTEAELLTRVHHRNLVSLVGYCDDGDVMALIYEYMVNGNLQEQLSGEKEKVLSWTERLKISIDAAQGLEYLHRGCKPAIVHRDLKPANILLDDKFQAKIADFGLSKIFKSDSASHISTEHVVGTRGYLDPEYHVVHRLNEKSDIYSFGVILLELITGQMAIVKTDSIVTHITVWVTHFIETGEIHEIVDKRLRGNYDINSAWKALETALACIPPSGLQRPSIDNVLADLKLCLEMDLESRKMNRWGEQNASSSTTIDGISFVDSEVNMGPSER